MSAFMVAITRCGAGPFPSRAAAGERFRGQLCRSPAPFEKSRSVASLRANAAGPTTEGDLPGHQTSAVMVCGSRSSRLHEGGRSCSCQHASPRFLEPCHFF